MPDHKGHYSILQYCPDPARAEAVNLGVALICPTLGFADVRLREKHKRVAKVFGKESFSPEWLTQAAEGVATRVRGLAGKSVEDLEAFIATRGNALLLTAQRSTRVVGGDTSAAIERLYRDLVADVAVPEVSAASRAPTSDGLKPRLQRAFSRPTLADRVESDQAVMVPGAGTRLDGLYAFQNGRLNYVLAKTFKEKPVEQALIYAGYDELLRKHPDTEQRERGLILVAEIGRKRELDELRRRVSETLKDLQTRVVWGDEIDAFADEVEREAH